MACRRALAAAAALGQQQAAATAALPAAAAPEAAALLGRLVAHEAEQGAALGAATTRRRPPSLLCSPPPLAQAAARPWAQESGESGSSGSGSGSSGSGSGSGSAAHASRADDDPGDAPPPGDSLTAALAALRSSSRAGKLTPAAITQQLDRHIVGQAAAKRAVAVALRNRWRRHRLPQHIAEEVGPTGCGKTEIARRLAKLVDAPFVKVEATKFTELGFVGRDVDEIVKDLADAALALTRARLAEGLRAAAGGVVEALLLRELCGDSPGMVEAFTPLYRAGELDDRLVTVDLDALGDATAAGPGGLASLGGPGGPLGGGGAPPGGAPGEGPGGAGAGGAGAAGHPLGALASVMEAMARRGGGDGGHRGGGHRGARRQRMPIAEARRLLLDAEVERCLASDRVVRGAARRRAGSPPASRRGTARRASPALSHAAPAVQVREALRCAGEDGIVFIDEIDKIVDASRGAAGATSSNVSSEGVQRDLLPILEGSVVTTKHGPVSTDHVLFICSGAFHSTKPGDMLAELQGRLPVRVELAGLTADDFFRILTEPAHNMLRQAAALLDTEGVALAFTDGAVRAIADAAETANRQLDNIGARRLHTVLERVLSEISFAAPDKARAAREAAPAADGSGSDDERGALPVRYEVTREMVEACMAEVLKPSSDLSRYLL
ncbi:hslU [Scenedesmus sp. PABB004]|nr:hslU [Scenedesmus sp. PABB004]